MRKTGIKGESKFVRGLITEATALSFPQDACTETFDCVFDRKGMVERRPAFELEGALTSHVTTSTAAYVEFIWTDIPSVSVDRTTFLVQQHGRFIRFYDVADNITPSANEKAFTIDLNSYRPATPTIDPASSFCVFAQGDGKLFIVNRGTEPLYVSYDSVGDTITVTAITLKERDFVGATETGWENNERYTGTVANLIAADPNHYYNLLNQSWHAGLEEASGGSAVVPPLQAWDAARTDLPSNSDTPWLYQGTAGALIGLFDPATIQKRTGGSTQAPKGHFILDVFGPSRTTAIANYPVGYTATVTGDRSDDKQRARCVAFFNGRVFYAGFETPGLTTSIYFSRIVEKEAHYGQCYQDNDATTEEAADLLPSDGGVIKIPDIAQINKLYDFRTSLLVFASNGVWIISGSSGQAFKANDYVVKKISSIGTHSRLSYVDVKGTPVWWGEEGIYTIKYDANYDSFNVVSITDGTIFSFLEAIPKHAIGHAKGAYDVHNDIVYWLYRNGSTEDINTFKYDRVLVMNGFSGAFYPWILNVSSKSIRGIIQIHSHIEDEELNHAIKFTTTTVIDATNENIGYSSATSTSYLDWGADDYSSYFITGYSVDGDAQRFFQANWIWVYLDTAANSSCFVQGLYDFTNSSSSGKWSTVQQIYNSSLLYRVANHRRLKIRGKGKALQLKFTSETGKPFSILGWSIWESQNAAP